MRYLTAANFNTLARPQEILETLRMMDAQKHVHRLIVRDMAEGRHPYALTLGKLKGLADTQLHVDACRLAKLVGMTVHEIEHPKNISGQSLQNVLALS